MKQYCWDIKFLFFFVPNIAYDDIIVQIVKKHEEFQDGRK